MGRLLSMARRPGMGGSTRPMMAFNWADQAKQISLCPLGRRDVQADAVADARARCFHGFVRQVRIARGGLDLRVTEELPDHREAFA